MAYEFYSGPFARPTGNGYSPNSTYPPRLYAHDPSFPIRNDSEMESTFTPNYGSGSRSPGYSTMPSGSHEDMGIHRNSSLPSTSTRPSHARTEEYLRKTLGIAEPLPLNLYSLPDTDGSKKPSVTDLARLAIWGSREKRLTLQQIYEAVEERYPAWKASTDKPWRRSIRHNLSLKAIFEHEERPNDHPGKGKYWVLNVSHGEATKRPRVRRDGTRGSQGSCSDFSEDDSTPPPTLGSQESGNYGSSHQYGSSSGGSVQSMPFNSSQQAMFSNPNTYPTQGRSMNSRQQYDSMNHSGLAYGYQQPPQSINPMMTMGDYGMPAIQQSSNLHHMGRGGGGTMMGTGFPNQTMQVSPHMDLYTGSPPLTTRSRRTHSDSFPDEDEDERTRGMPKVRRSTD